jgi:hypothetical protein
MLATRSRLRVCVCRIRRPFIPVPVSFLPSLLRVFVSSFPSVVSSLSAVRRHAYGARNRERIEKTEKELVDKQKHHRDEIQKIQETAKQVQQAAVAKQTQAQQLVEGQ